MASTSRSGAASASACSGPNGAGKTTTVEILEGLLEPSAGEVELLGMSWARDDVRLRERIGVALQETRLPERLTVTEVLDLFRSFYRRARPVDALLADVELGRSVTRGSASCRADSGSGSRSRARWSASPTSCSSTSPPPGWIPQSRRQLWELVLRFAAGAARSC